MTFVYYAGPDAVKGLPQKSIDTIIIKQWVMMHLDHPQNIQYVRPEKGVYH